MRLSTNPNLVSKAVLGDILVYERLGAGYPFFLENMHIFIEDTTKSKEATVWDSSSLNP